MVIMDKVEVYDSINNALKEELKDEVDFKKWKIDSLIEKIDNLLLQFEMSDESLFEALELLEKTKGIPVDYMLEKVEAALVSAFKKEYGTSSQNRYGIALEFSCIWIVDNVLQKCNLKHFGENP